MTAGIIGLLYLQFSNMSGGKLGMRSKYTNLFIKSEDLTRFITVSIYHK